MFSYISFFISKRLFHIFIKWKRINFILKSPIKVFTIRSRKYKNVKDWKTSHQTIILNVQKLLRLSFGVIISQSNLFKYFFMNKRGPFKGFIKISILDLPLPQHQMVSWMKTVFRFWSKDFLNAEGDKMTMIRNWKKTFYIFRLILNNIDE